MPNEVPRDMHTIFANVEFSFCGLTRLIAGDLRSGPPLSNQWRPFFSRVIDQRGIGCALTRFAAIHPNSANL